MLVNGAAEGSKPANVAWSIVVYDARMKSSADSISIWLRAALAGRDAVAMRPSGAPVLKVNVAPQLEVAIDKPRASNAVRQRILAISCLCGGDEGDRTLDLRIANAALSQLSYVPTVVKL
jgi:hypothetical protein